jgi:hypothetical protein
VQTGFSSAREADYNLEFSWTCRFLPYFCIRVDDWEWGSNAAAKALYEPTDNDNKQCPSTKGSLTVALQLPRRASKVAVRLLDTNVYDSAVQVDATPAIRCDPYIHNRGASGCPGVCDTAITDADLFIECPNPTQADIQEVDSYPSYYQEESTGPSPFRWIMIARSRSIDHRTPQDDLTRAYIEVVDSYRLGNATAPILATFEEMNLAPPTVTSGTVKITRFGQPVQINELPSLTAQPLTIFDGFTNNPADYDTDTNVDFTFKSVDTFGCAAYGWASFYGKSIIYQQLTVIVHVFDPAKVAKFQAVARDLIERGLIDIAIGLPSDGPTPRPTDPDLLLQRLHSNRTLSGLIDQTLSKLWKDEHIWQDIWKTQSEVLTQVDRNETIWINRPARVGGLLKAANALRTAEQRKYDAVVINTFAQKTIAEMHQDPAFISNLRRLW